MASSSMSVGVEERGKRRGEGERERKSLLLINGGRRRGVSGRCRDEAGLHSHGWAPHCKQREGTRAAFPSRNAAWRRTCGKALLPGTSSTRQSVLRALSESTKKATSPVSLSVPHQNALYEKPITHAGLLINVGGEGSERGRSSLEPLVPASTSI